MDVKVSDRKFLTADEIVERYRGEVSVGTLPNWSSERVGLAFVKRLEPGALTLGVEQSRRNAHLHPARPAGCETACHGTPG